MNPQALLQTVFLLAFAASVPIALAEARDPADVSSRPALTSSGSDAQPNADVQSAVRAALAALPPGPTGDAATACEVILCLAGSAGAGGRVVECIPPIRKFLTSFIPPRLFTKRLNFLKLCPMGSAGERDPNMQSLLPILVNAPHDNEGVCNAGAVNRVNTVSLGDGETIIANTMPGECSGYFNHPYTDLQERVPVYVGEPSEGGFWASQEDYPAALALYQQQVEERRRDGGSRFRFGNSIR